MNRSTAAAAGLAATLAAVTLFVWLAQRKLIYLPFGEAPDPESVGLTGVASATLETEDGLKLSGWFVRPDQTPWFTVIVFNGNAGNRAMRAPLAGMLRRHGIATLLFAGDCDRIIPLAHSRRLFAAGNEPKSFVVIRNADHNDAALLDGEEMIASIVQFLRGG